MNAHLKLSLLKNIKENILHFDDKLVDFEKCELELSHKNGLTMKSAHFKSDELNILAKWILSDMETIVLEHNKKQAVNQLTIGSAIQTLNKN